MEDQYPNIKFAKVDVEEQEVCPPRTPATDPKSYARVAMFGDS